MKNVKLISLGLAMLICFITKAREKTITGTVSDASGPLPGVQIVIQKTSKTTTTTFDGKYTIQAQKGDQLVFSYIGYKSQTKKVGAQNIINVKLIADQMSLNEVVVVGYGSNAEYESDNYLYEKKKTSPAASVQTLIGRVPGVTISSNNNAIARAPQNIVIRGTTSSSSKNEPLYIIDGVPVQSNVLAKINPNDIQDINVLKDSAATSLYGARAANGVVVINSKNEIYKNLSEKEINKRLKQLDPYQPEANNTEDYESFVENTFESPKTAPLSTFSIDVDYAAP
jgi:Ca-activated chloride channel homolog